MRKITIDPDSKLGNICFELNGYHYAIEEVKNDIRNNMNRDKLVILYTVIGQLKYHMEILSNTLIQEVTKDIKDISNLDFNIKYNEYVIEVMEIEEKSTE